jgi:hypothetical protein
MQPIRIRIEDGTSAVVVHARSETEDVPWLMVATTAPQDGLRARSGARHVHRGWARALEACRAVEATSSRLPLRERHARALTNFLVDGPLAGDAASYASLLLSGDALALGPAPDASSPGRPPHLLARLVRADLGHGPETVVSVQAAPGLLEWFNVPLGTDPGLGERWHGGADLALARRIRSMLPFSDGPVRIEQGSDQPPVAVARLDAATVAVAYAAVLGTPLPVRRPPLPPLREPSPTPDLPALPRGEGRLTVRFSGPEGTVTLLRSGGARDVPDVIARIAGLPLLPLALEATADPVAGLLGSREVGTAGLAPDSHPIPLWSARSCAGLVFAAEPGLWEPCPEGTPAEKPPDVTVSVERSPHPPEGGGTPDARRVVRILPSARFHGGAGDDPALAAHRINLAEWRVALGVDWFRFDQATAGFEADFAGAFRAVLRARRDGASMPGSTPYGPLPDPGALRKPGCRQPPDPEELLAPAEIALQRRGMGEGRTSDP